MTLPIGKEAFEPSQIDEKNRININIPQSAIFDFSPQSLVEAADDILNSDSVADDDSNKILIVDDNNELLMLMKQLLKSKYHVLTANNGLKALEIIKNNDLDLIVSDLMMPEMDGWELTEKIKTNKDYSHLPIILLTARTQEEDKRKSLVIGADEYMCKPFKMSELTLRIKNIIENRNRIRRDFTSKSIEEVERPASNIASIDNELLQKAIECMRQRVQPRQLCGRHGHERIVALQQAPLHHRLECKQLHARHTHEGGLPHSKRTSQHPYKRVGL